MTREQTWTDLIAVNDLQKDDVTCIELGQHLYAVFDAADKLYVTSATCTHSGANLCDGYFDGHTIECPLHQGCFDIRSGATLGAPVVTPLKCYECRVNQGIVQIVV